MRWAWGPFAGYERLVVFLQMMRELRLNAGMNQQARLPGLP